MKGLPRVLHIDIVQPKYILVIVIILMGMMIAMGLYEISASKQGIMHILREEAVSLAEAISIMGDNSLVCFGEIEYLVTERLLNNARLLERLDSESVLSAEMLRDIAEQNTIHGIRVYNGDGSIILDSHAQEEPVPPQLWTLIEAFLSSDEDEIVITLDEADRFAVAVRRRKGGAIVLGMDSAEMPEFRRSIGIGSLIQAIGENEGIEYIVLQDENGLILASRNVTQMRRIAGDDFLQNALDHKRVDMRSYVFDGREAMEVVNPF